MGDKRGVTRFAGFYPHGLGQRPGEAAKGNHILGRILIVDGRIQVSFLATYRRVHSVAHGSRAFPLSNLSLLIITLGCFVEEVGGAVHAHFLEFLLVNILQLG